MSQPFLTDEELKPACDFYGITIEEGRINHAKVMSQGDDPARPICIGCAKWPEEIQEYIDAVQTDSLHNETPTEYVISEEGTYNPANGHFLCTACYILNGSPTNSRGWKCP